MCAEMHNSFMQKGKPRIVYLFSDNIRKRRTEIGLTQSQLAERVGISIRHLSDIERADTFPSPEIIELIAAEFGVDSYTLFLPGEVARKELLLSSRVKAILDEELEKAIENTSQRVKNHLR